jgi:hypothetical protein
VLVLVCSETSVWVPTAAGKVENHDDVAKKKMKNCSRRQLWKWLRHRGVVLRREMTCDRNEGACGIFTLFFIFNSTVIVKKFKKYQKGRFIYDIIPDVEDALSGKF